MLSKSYCGGHRLLPKTYHGNKMSSSMLRPMEKALPCGYSVMLFSTKVFLPSTHALIPLYTTSFPLCTGLPTHDLYMLSLCFLLCLWIGEKQGNVGNIAVSWWDGGITEPIVLSPTRANTQLQLSKKAHPSLIRNGCRERMLVAFTANKNIAIGEELTIMDLQTDKTTNKRY